MGQTIDEVLQAAHEAGHEVNILEHLASGAMAVFVTDKVNRHVTQYEFSTTGEPVPEIPAELVPEVPQAPQAIEATEEATEEA
jgi:hypothetical protein